MADKFIRHQFPKGEFRAIVRTAYHNALGESLSVDSDPVPFTVNVKEYFTFATNNDIQIDLDTLEAPNAELVDEGKYFGFDYKTYDNGLAIVTGEQDTAMTSDDRTAAPWNGDDIEYCYADAVYLSGYILGSSHYIETYIGGSFAAGVTSVRALLMGANHEFVHNTGLDVSQLTEFNSMFIFKTIDLENFNAIFDHFIGSDQVTNLSGLFGFSVYGDLIERGQRTPHGTIINIIIGDQIEAADSIIYGDLPNYKVEIETDNNLQYMFNYSIGNWDEVRIHCSVYMLDSLKSCKARRLFVSCPLTGVTTLPSNMLLNATNLEDIQFASDMDFSGLTELGNVFYGLTNLKTISKLPVNVDEPFTQFDYNVFDLINVTRASRMFYGCSNLEECGIPDTQTLTAMSGMGFTNMFDGCAKLKKSINYTFRRTTRAALYIDAFKNSGFENITVNIFVSSTSREQVYAEEAFKDCKNLKQVHIIWNYDNKIPGLRLNNALQGCDNLESLYIEGPTFDPAQSHLLDTTNINGICTDCANLEEVTIEGGVMSGSTDAFKNCTKLKRLIFLYCSGAYPSYGAMGQIQGYNQGISSELLSGCTALERLRTPYNMEDDTMARDGHHSVTITLPVPMYKSGSSSTTTSATTGATEYTKAQQ